MSDIDDNPMPVIVQGEKAIGFHNLTEAKEYAEAHDHNWISFKVSDERVILQRIEVLNFDNRKDTLQKIWVLCNKR